jgi:hypothetical protein
MKEIRAPLEKGPPSVSGSLTRVKQAEGAMVSSASYLRDIPAMAGASKSSPLPIARKPRRP